MLQAEVDKQVCQIPPPYVSTPTWMYPSPRLLLTGLTLSTGESVCAPSMEIGFPGCHFLPTAKATIVELFRVR